jgi:signal peptidase I
MRVIPLQASNDIEPEAAVYTERGHERSLGNRPFQELLIDVFRKGAAFRFKAKGFSMSPFIKDSDVITVAPVSKHRPRLGDVVVFINPDTEKLVIHRVVGKRDKYTVFTRGDNIPFQKHLVPLSQILGMVKRVERKGRAVALGLGPEKALIALLSRQRLLLPLLVPAGRIIRLILRGVSRWASVLSHL